MRWGRRIRETAMGRYKGVVLNWRRTEVGVVELLSLVWFGHLPVADYVSSVIAHGRPCSSLAEGVILHLFCKFLPLSSEFLLFLSFFLLLLLLNLVLYLHQVFLLPFTPFFLLAYDHPAWHAHWLLMLRRKRRIRLSLEVTHHILLLRW